MNEQEVNTKLENIKKQTPQIIASALDIAHRTEQLARLHGSLRGNNQPDTLVSSVIGMIPVEMSGETFLFAKRVEIKRAMEAFAKQAAAFWADVDAVTSNSYLGIAPPREAPMPSIDFGQMLKATLPPAGTVSGSPAISGIGGTSSRADRPRVVTRPPDVKPAGDSNAA